MIACSIEHVRFCQLWAVALIHVKKKFSDHPVCLPIIFYTRLSATLDCLIFRFENIIFNVKKNGSRRKFLHSCDEQHQWCADYQKAKEIENVRCAVVSCIRLCHGQMNYLYIHSFRSNGIYERRRSTRTAKLWI